MDSRAIAWLILTLCVACIIACLAMYHFRDGDKND